jgi:TP901 family phage tail tape measure protein
MREAITTATDPFFAPDVARVGFGLARMEGADPGQITAMLAQVRNAYSLTFNEMERLPDIMFTMVDEGRVKLGQIAQQLGDVAGIARVAGISMEDLMSAVTALTRGGMSPARAMTSLRAFSELVQKRVPKAVREARARAGLDLSPRALQGKDFGRVLDEIRMASERSGFTIAQLLGGKARALKGILQLSGALRDDFDQIRQQMDQSAGRAEAARRLLIGSDAGKMERLQATWDTGMATVGEKITQVFLEAVAGGDDFNTALEDILKTFRQIGDVVEGIGQVGGWFMKGGFAGQLLEGTALEDYTGPFGALKGTKDLGMGGLNLIPGGDGMGLGDRLFAARELYRERQKLRDDEHAQIIKHFQKTMAIEKKNREDRLAALKGLALEEHRLRREKLEDFKALMEGQRDILRRGLDEQLALHKTHAQNLANVQLKLSNLILANEERLEDRKIKKAGDAEKFLRLRRRQQAYEESALTLTGRGQFDLAGERAGRGVKAAEGMEGLDMNQLLGMTWTDIDRLAREFAGGRKAKIGDVRAERRKILDIQKQYRRGFTRAQFQGKGATFGEDFIGEQMQRGGITQETVMRAEMRHERTAAQFAMDEAKKRAEALAKLNESLLQVDHSLNTLDSTYERLVSSMDGNKQSIDALTQAINEFTDSPQRFADAWLQALAGGEEAGAVQAGETPLSKLAEAGGLAKKYHIEQHFHGPADRKIVGDATASALKEAEDRGVENSGANK